MDQQIWTLVKNLPIAIKSARPTQLNRKAI